MSRPRTATCTTDGCASGQPANHRTDDGLPVCADCAHARRARGLDAPVRDGVPVRANAFGVNRDGRIPEGAEPWEWRPPQATPDLHHDQEIQIGSATCYQRSPPVHVMGSTPRATNRRPTSASPPAKRVEARHDVAAFLDDAPLTNLERKAMRLYATLPKAGRLRAIADALGATETAAEKLLARAKNKARLRARSAITEDELRVR